MIERKITVNLTTGLQARPAAKFVQEANRYSSNVFLEKDNKRVNAKSIMGLMSLAVGTGEEILLVADGADEEDVISELTAFVSKEQ
ncbi:catabolite repression HPr-like protein [Salirhabdus euzebyi]|uniref:Catabolite repression HPr-like protein n=1 Tax=Salirhabdus euzebyi TaxID=394506 RepID=A0A841Q5E0_9BACI|nr:HPr family phosphocarrier protein [Salirhabdus euzebyi]MBB6453577.1 catabolite repression HPr-like protein [Salirhabdus euzebyi]